MNGKKCNKRCAHASHRDYLPHATICSVIFSRVGCRTIVFADFYAVRRFRRLSEDPLFRSLKSFNELSPRYLWIFAAKDISGLLPGERFRL